MFLIILMTFKKKSYELCINLIVFVSFYSSVASNNAQIRCNFVDLYYSLFGSKVPNILAKNEQPLSMGLPKIPKIPKISDKKRSASPFDNGISPKPSTATAAVADEPVDIEIKREPETVNKPVEVNDEPIDIVKVIDAVDFILQI